LSEHNFRADGRRPNELRSLSLLLSPHAQADGSATVIHGLTSVMVTVHGPHEARSRAGSLHDRGAINVQVDIPGWSGVTTSAQRRSRNDKRTLEFAANIKATFEPVVQLNLYPRSHIDISVQVLQSDGSLLQAAINATTLALIDAGVPMNDYVCAVTCALHDNTPLLDINSLEESDLPNVTVGILPRSSKVTLATLETQLSVDRFPEILRLTGEAAKAIHAEMILSVKARTDRLARAMDGIDKPVASKEDVEMAEA